MRAHAKRHGRRLSSYRAAHRYLALDHRFYPALGRRRRGDGEVDEILSPATRALLAMSLHSVETNPRHYRRGTGAVSPTLRPPS